MESSEVRRRFLAYFQAHGHTVVQSSSLIPGNDPTLLFVNAGMVQFKDVFIGTEKRPYARATTAQKCMRVSGKHNDLDQVGPSPRHHTFFEMLGNFSFGDYFKRDAISFAWEFLTRELGLDANRLWPTVYIEDDEAYNLWQGLTHVPAERISRLGKKDNFWAMGDTGPCGPDSEIFWDRGHSFCTCGNPNCSPATGCDRFMEIWNLVFMQYEARADGTMVPLPRPSVDTGMGLERVTSVLQGVENNYDTDLFIPVMCRTQELLGHDDAARLANQTAYRVIADHSRALAFLIADGVLPGNEGRSYVLRMILRRAARFGRLLGFDEPFLAETAQTVINTMGHHYHELVERQDFIREVITREEKQFLNTLNQGLVRLDELAERLQADGETMIPGAEAFRLYDTYGFPFELTRDASQEKGFTVDEAGFRQAMLEQKERARSVRRRAMGDEAETYRLLKLPKTAFLGYEQFNTTSRIIAIIQDGKVVDQVSAGQSADIVLDVTPFYAESGGQVGDTGVLKSEFGEAQVTDTVKPVPEVYVQRVLVETGALKTGETVDARVEIERRLDIARNHTATHLLHRALRQVIGEHAAQSGSLVLPDRLRFDFSHLQALSPAELAMVEDKVNAVIRDARPVTTQVLNYDDALKTGAVALFGEKYGAQVRVVNVEGYSKELCGGTHLRNSGQIGLFLILSESSIGSGLRRIEAVTGRGALGWVRSKTAELDELQRAMGVHPGEQVGHYNALLDELKDVKRQLADVQRSQAAANVESLMNKAITVKDANVLAVEVDVPNIDALRELADRFRDKLGSALVALGAVIDGKPFVVVAATPDLVSRGVHAGKIAGAAAQQMGGGGGGKPNMAQAGGKDSSRLAQALSVVARLAEEALS